MKLVLSESFPNQQIVSIQSQYISGAHFNSVLRQDCLLSAHSCSAFIFSISLLCFGKGDAVPADLMHGNAFLLEKKGQPQCLQASLEGWVLEIARLCTSMLGFCVNHISAFTC